MIEVLSMSALRKFSSQADPQVLEGLQEAAALLESLVQNHPFVDGNKRVAFAVVDVFLRINGYSITADSKAIYDHMIKLVEARAFDMEHLVPWLQEIVRPRA